MKTKRVKGARRAKGVKNKGPIQGLTKWEVAVVKETFAECERRHWSMEQLAKAAGMTRQGVSYIKHYQRAMKFATVIKIARAFKMQLEIFIHRSRRWRV